MPTHPLRAYYALTVYEQGKRGIANFHRVHAYLQRRFSPVATVLTTGYAGLSMAEQFKMLADTTVGSPRYPLTILHPLAENKMHPP